MSVRKECAVCKQWFDSEDGLVSCTAHSFGERDVSIDGMEAFLQEMFCEENPQLLDDDLPDAFSNWLSNQDLDSINDCAHLYCHKMRSSYDSNILAEEFYKVNFGKLS